MEPKRSLKKLRHLFSIGLVAMFLSLGFQNCGGKFEVSTSALSSLACKPSLKKASLPASIGPVACHDYTSYSCVVRTYSPTQSNAEVAESICDATGACATVKRLSFNSLPALEESNRIEFEPGGEYNRTDARCAHQLKFEGSSIAVGESFDADSALERAIATCDSLEGVNR